MAITEARGMTDEQVDKALNTINMTEYVKQARGDYLRGIVAQHQGRSIEAIHRMASAAYAYEIVYQMAILTGDPEEGKIRDNLIRTHATLERMKKVSEVQRTSYREERPRTNS